MTGSLILEDLPSPVGRLMRYLPPTVKMVSRITSGFSGEMPVSARALVFEFILLMRNSSFPLMRASQEACVRPVASASAWAFSIALPETKTSRAISKAAASNALSLLSAFTIISAIAVLDMV
ncbi:hypothetical protein D3C76_1530100 [compost metagenome]